MVASGAVCGDAREWIASAGTVELNSGVGGLSIDFMPTAPCD